MTTSENEARTLFQKWLVEEFQVSPNAGVEPMSADQADRLLSHVERSVRDPQWDQSVWRDTKAECGTSHCVAGFVVEDNPRYAWDGDDESNLIEVLDAETLQPAGRVAEVARRELGLTKNEADALFNSDNDADMLRAIASGIALGWTRTVSSDGPSPATAFDRLKREFQRAYYANPARFSPIA